MNVLVVNGSGSIGSALVSELSNEGANVVYTSSKDSANFGMVYDNIDARVGLKIRIWFRLKKTLI